MHSFRIRWDGKRILHCCTVSYAFLDWWCKNRQILSSPNANTCLPCPCILLLICCFQKTYWKDAGSTFTSVFSSSSLMIWCKSVVVNGLTVAPFSAMWIGQFSFSLSILAWHCDFWHAKTSTFCFSQECTSIDSTSNCNPVSSLNCTQATNHCMQGATVVCALWTMRLILRHKNRTQTMTYSRSCKWTFIIESNNSLPT